MHDTFFSLFRTRPFTLCCLQGTSLNDDVCIEERKPRDYKMVIYYLFIALCRLRQEPSGFWFMLTRLCSNKKEMDLRAAVCGNNKSVARVVHCMDVFCPPSPPLISFDVNVLSIVERDITLHRLCCYNIVYWEKTHNACTGAMTCQVFIVNDVRLASYFRIRQTIPSRETLTIPSRQT